MKILVVLKGEDLFVNSGYDRCVVANYTEFTGAEYSVYFDEAFQVGRGDVLTIAYRMLPNRSVNDSMMLLLLLVHAVREMCGITARVRVFMPFIPYMRQDRATHDHGFASWKMVCDLLKLFAIEIVTCDPHSAHAAGQFPRMSTISHYDIFSNITREIVKSRHGAKNVMVIAPDDGGVNRIRDWMRTTIAHTYGALKKVRNGSEVTVSARHDDTIKAIKSANVVIVVDDIIDSGATMRETISFIKQFNARAIIYVLVTHVVNYRSLLSIRKDVHLIMTTNSLNRTLEGNIQMVDISKFINV